MQCSGCKKQIDDDAKFCSSCGGTVFVIDNIGAKSADKHFEKKRGICQMCGRQGPVKYIEFYQNIGVIVMRYGKSIKGELCKGCITQTFWQFTLVDLFFGWWGIISFFITPFYILNNLFRYLMSLRLPKIEENVFYCNKCGDKLESQNKFCGNCGIKITEK